MPIIIYGTRGLSSRLDSGRFYCPLCEGERPYTLEQVREFFSLFWIPLIPIGSGQRFVRCGTCGTPFEEGVLELGPPPREYLTGEGEEPSLEQVFGEPGTEEGPLGFAQRELLRGASVGIVVGHLQEAGLDSEGAEEAVGRMCGGPPKRCETCGRRYHPAILQCDDCRRPL